VGVGKETELSIRAKAPLRVSFAGGGTDVPPYPEREGGCVLNATITSYAYGTLQPRKDEQIRIVSLDYGVAVDYDRSEIPIYDGNLDLAKAAISRLGMVKVRGFDLLLHSEAPPGSGLGASSAVAVVLVGLLKEYGELSLTPYEIADLAYRVEREELQIAGGLQDQYAAAFGGFNFIEFLGDRVVVNPLRVRQDIINELEYSLLLCYTGKTRLSARIIDDQVSRYKTHESETVEGMRRLKEIAVEMKNALLLGELSAFGELLDQAWRNKKKLSTRITSPFIEQMYEQARRDGALGGKITGAGGGGYLLLYCRPEQKHAVAQRLKKMGGTVSDVSFSQFGLQTWRGVSTSA